MSGPVAAILDIDGTLVDSNYHHAIAWYRAFCAHDILLPVWRIHRHVGMGGDQLVAALCGDDVEREREVLRLRFVEDLTQAEIGARIGVSQMQVSRLIRQSLARLRTAALAAERQATRDQS